MSLLPEVPRYAYRARRYRWAERNIAAAEATHGPPGPVCSRCGARLPTRNVTRFDFCAACLAAEPEETTCL